MKDEDRINERLLSELVQLRQRNAVLEASEAECQQAEEALRENQKLLNSILQSTGDGILVGNPDGTFSYSNSRFAVM